MVSRHLLNPLAPLDNPTPSAIDGISLKLEKDLRAYGALLIQQVGLMLGAFPHRGDRPQVVMATAQVLFQRFWFVTSLKHFGIRDMGLGALFLASKLEESPLRIRDLINCYSFLLAYITHFGETKVISPSIDETATRQASFHYEPMDYFATEFYDTKDALVIAEMQLLKRLGFQTQSGLPYGHLVNYLRVLELTGHEAVVKASWGYANDMLQTSAPALYPQATLAVAAIYLATRRADPPIALPLEPEPWWVLFDASEEDVIEICRKLLELYRDWGPDSGERFWRTAGSLPVDKQGVRDLISDDRSPERI